MVINSVFDLYIALLKELRYGFFQSQMGHPGVFIALSYLCSEYDVDPGRLSQLVEELEKWSDLRKLPSLTTLMRIPVGYRIKDEVVVDDVVTWILTNHPQEILEGENIRKTLGIRMGNDGAFEIFRKGDSDWSPAWGKHLDMEQALKQKNMFERDLLTQFYTMDWPVNILP